jgi:hypothetical protein
LLLPSTWACSLLFYARFIAYSGVDYPAEGEKTKQRRHLAKKIAPSESFCFLLGSSYMRGKLFDRHQPT